MSKILDLKKLGNDIIRKVRSDLAIGRGNVDEDIVRTNRWSETMVSYKRQHPRWVKDNNKWKLVFDEKPGLEVGIKNIAKDAARAVHNKVGNCGEMTDVGIRHLCEYFLNYKKQNPAFDLNNIIISMVVFPKRLDHVLIKLTIKTVGEKEIIESIYIDPWLGTCFYSTGFEKFKTEIIAMLVNEKIQYAKKSIEQQTNATLPVFLATPEYREQVEEYNLSQLNQYIQLNDITIESYTKELTENTLTNSFMIQDEFAILEFSQEFDEELNNLNLTKANVTLDELRNNLVKAIKDKNDIPVSTYLAQLGMIDGGIILAAINSNDAKIIEKTKSAIEKIDFNPDMFYDKTAIGLEKVTLENFNKIHEFLKSIYKESYNFDYLIKNNENNKKLISYIKNKAALSATSPVVFSVSSATVATPVSTTVPSAASTTKLNNKDDQESGKSSQLPKK